MIQKLIEKLNKKRLKERIEKLRFFTGGYRQDDDYVCRYEKLSACCDRISG